MPIDSIPDVISEMRKLSSELAETNLANVKAFNQTYLIITRAVYSKFGSSYFQDEDKMTTVDITFFRYYQTPLTKYQLGESVPPAWQSLFDFAQKNSSYQFVYMALGVNAHVNNDLPPTLLEVGASNAFKPDYDLVNDVIGESIKEVIYTLDEESYTLNFFENKLQPLYGVVLSELIKQWRQIAWNNFIKLQEGTISVKDIESYAQKIAIKLTEVESPQDIVKLKDIVFPSRV